jgi:very-short-patch-repair endonuclease
MGHQPPQINRIRARTMRRDPTRAESLLWQALRDRRLEGYKFRRQVPLEHYILDLVCFDAMLIVEVDGSQHAGSLRDMKRDAVFRARGFRILRVWNDDVIDHMDGTLRTILTALAGRDLWGEMPPLE